MPGEKDFDLSGVYEHLIDWPDRLAREEGFFRSLFERAGAGSVLDTACGTGEHAAMFHSWGLEVEGADVDPVMIDRARDAFGEPPGLRWTVRGFDQPANPERPWDAALCVGNSLAMAPDAGVVGKAVAEMFAAIREGGFVALHLLNPWRLEDGPSLWQKCRPFSGPSGEAFVLKGIHRSGKKMYIDLVVIPVSDPAGFRSTFFPLICLEAPEIEAMALEAGAGEMEFYGGYLEQPYLREESVDLVMVARKKR